MLADVTKLMLLVKTALILTRTVIMNHFEYCILLWKSRIRKETIFSVCEEIIISCRFFEKHLWLISLSEKFRCRCCYLFVVAVVAVVVISPLLI